MRIPEWSEAAAPRDRDLVAAVLARRGGKLINLDRVLLWSAPVTRGWNAFLGAVRKEIGLSPRLREIAICTVARVTGAEYEFSHHWPDYLSAGGDDALRALMEDPYSAAENAAFSADERLAMRYAIAMTRDVQVPDALFTQLRARFSTQEIVELTVSIAAYNMVARVLVALQVDEDRR